MKHTIQLFLTFLVLLLLSFFLPHLAEAKQATITDLRWTSRNDGDPPFVRIAMDLTKAVHA